MNKFKKYAVDNETASSHVTSSQQSAYDELRDQVISDIKAGRY